MEGRSQRRPRLGTTPPIPSSRPNATATSRGTCSGADPAACGGGADSRTTVASERAFYAETSDGADDISYVFTPVSGIVGAYNLSQGTWKMTFTDHTPYADFTIHLEGSLFAACVE